VNGPLKLATLSCQIFSTNGSLFKHQTCCLFSSTAKSSLFLNSTEFCLYDPTLEALPPLPPLKIGFLKDVMRTRTSLLGGLLPLIGVASTWNTDVHNQIGFMAETFLAPYTIGVLQNILEPQYNGSIGRGASWADAYAHTAEGRFSYQWHWIDSEDTVCLPTNNT
jgi:hypothetical protein